VGSLPAGRQAENNLNQIYSNETYMSTALTKDNG